MGDRALPAQEKNSRDQLLAAIRSSNRKQLKKVSGRGRPSLGPRGAPVPGGACPPQLSAQRLRLGPRASGPHSRVPGPSALCPPAAPGPYSLKPRLPGQLSPRPAGQPHDRVRDRLQGREGRPCQRRASLRLRHAPRCPPPGPGAAGA